MSNKIKEDVIDTTAVAVPEVKLEMSIGTIWDTQEHNEGELSFPLGDKLLEKAEALVDSLGITPDLVIDENNKSKYTSIRTGLNKLVAEISSSRIKKVREVTNEANIFEATIKKVESLLDENSKTVSEAIKTFTQEEKIAMEKHLSDHWDKIKVEVGLEYVPYSWFGIKVDSTVLNSKDGSKAKKEISSKVEALLHSLTIIESVGEAKDLATEYFKDSTSETFLDIAKSVSKATATLEKERAEERRLEQIRLDAIEEERTRQAKAQMEELATIVGNAQKRAEIETPVAPEPIPQPSVPLPQVQATPTLSGAPVAPALKEYNFSIMMSDDQYVDLKALIETFVSANPGAVIKEVSVASPKPASLF